MREKRDLETRSRPEMQLIKKYFRMVLGFRAEAQNVAHIQGFPELEILGLTMGGGMFCCPLKMQS